MWGHGLSTRPRRLWALAGAAALLGGTAGSWTQHHLPKDAVRPWVFVGIAYTLSRETRPSGFRTSEGEEMWATQQTRQGLRYWTLGRGEAGLPGLGAALVGNPLELTVSVCAPGFVRGWLRGWRGEGPVIVYGFSSASYT